MQPGAENYPPSAWLEREGWEIPVLVDDAANSVANSYGLTQFPFTVFVDASGQVAGRVTGAIPVETFVLALEQLAGR